MLRDHAPPQLRDLSGIAAKKGHAAGAPVGPRHAGLWRHRPGVVWPAAWQPASAARAAGTRGLGSNAGSNALACTCAHSPCAGTAADADTDGRLAYDDDSPREGVTSQGTDRGGTRERSSSGAYSKTGKRPAVRQSIRPRINQTVMVTASGHRSQGHDRNETAKETVLEMHERRKEEQNIRWLSSDARNWLSFFDRSHHLTET